MVPEKHIADKSKSLSAVLGSVEIVEISLDFIEWRDQSTFVRYAVDGDQVENLKTAYAAGGNVPPVELFSEGASVTSKRTAGGAEKKSGEPRFGAEHQVGRIRYYIGDGWHRFHALRELGRAVIPAVVHSGGRREALKCALGANAGFGLRRTNRDKRKAVAMAMREFPRLSNRAVAELCKVSHEMVNALRPLLADSASSRVGQDGKTRRVAGRDAAGRDTSGQQDFFELLGREWSPVLKSFELTIRSVAWLDERVVPERKLEAISAMRRQLDDMRVQLAERERAIKAGIGGRGAMLDTSRQESDTTVTESALVMKDSAHTEDSFA